MMRRPLTYAIAQPVLWGLRRGFSVRQLSRGLMLRERTLVNLIVMFGPSWLGTELSRELARRLELDSRRAERDWAYANWARAAAGAADRLDAMGEM